MGERNMVNKINKDPHKLITEKVKSIKEFSNNLENKEHIKHINKMVDDILEILSETEVYVKSNPMER